MKSQCQVCQASFRGIPLMTVKDGKQVEVCPACYKTLDEAYRKNSCYACVFFNSGTCELFGTDLEEPYTQKDTCGYFTTEDNPKAIGMAKIKKFEMTGRFEDAAKEYEKLDMPAKAAEERKKIKEAVPPQELDVDALVKQLAERGQALTYFCCHCGAALKVGAKNEILKNCPNCKYDLTVIDMGRLISQHL